MTLTRRRKLISIAVGILFLCMVGWTFLMAIGWSVPHVQQASFSELPRIDEITDSKSSMECEYIRYTHPHRIRICVLGKVADKSELLQTFPFLEGEESIPGASCYNSEIPEQFNAPVGAGDTFSQEDVYWNVSVESNKNKGGFSVEIAFSEMSGRFYLEYGWGQ